MFGHQRLTARIEIIDEDHGVVTEGLAGEDLSESHQVGVGHLLPLVHQPHTLGVNQPVAVDPAQTHVLPSLDVDSFVDCRHVAECGGLVQGRGRGWLQGAQTCKVINLAGKIRKCFWVRGRVTDHLLC